MALALGTPEPCTEKGKTASFTVSVGAVAFRHVTIPVAPARSRAMTAAATASRRVREGLSANASSPASWYRRAGSGWRQRPRIEDAAGAARSDPQRAVDAQPSCRAGIGSPDRTGTAPKLAASAGSGSRDSRRRTCA